MDCAPWTDTLVGDWCPRFRYATLLRVCRNYAFNLSMTDETGFYAPSMAHNALPSRPWLGISVFHGIISTVSKPLRYSLTGSMCATTADGDLRYLLFAKTQVLYCGFGIWQSTYRIWFISQSVRYLRIPMICSSWSISSSLWCSMNSSSFCTNSICWTFCVNIFL